LYHATKNSIIATTSAISTHSTRARSIQAPAGGTGAGNNLVLDISSFYNPAQPDVYPIVLAT
jgi:hypothetical protein